MRLNWASAGRLRRTGIYGLFAIYMLLMHLPLPYCGDDAYLLPLVGVRGFWEHFTTLYHYNGKIFTDFSAFLFYHLPYGVWKVFNTASFVLAAVLLCRIFTKNRPRDGLITCALVAVFPLRYLGTAGYIATCCNYLYPFTGILLVALQMKDLFAGKTIGAARHLLLVPVMAYTLNQDQAACILTGGLFLLTLSCAFFRPHNKKLLCYVGAYFLVSAIGYGLMFIMPGHLNRMADPLEMNIYLPEFAQWSLPYKLYRGYTSTLAQVFLNDPAVCLLFFFLLGILCQEKGTIFQKILSFLPLIGMLAVQFVGAERFLRFKSEMPDLRSLSALSGLAGLLFGSGCILIMVYLICRCVRGQNKFLLLGILILGAGSRLMMGLSATLYASQQRTFTYLLFSLLAGSLLLVQEIKTQKSQICGTVGILLALLLQS